MIAPDGPFELPDCDPPALRAAAHALSGLSGVLSDQAAAVDGVVGASTSWTGQAQTLWARVGGREGDDLRTSHRALVDAASALNVLAGKLEDAQSRFATHMTRADDASRLALSRRASAASSGGRPPDTSDLEAEARREARAAESAAHDAHAAAAAAEAEFDRIAGTAPDPPVTIPETGQVITPGDPRPTPQMLATVLGTVRVDAQGNPVELDLQDPETIRGTDLQELATIARAMGWTEGNPARRGGGGLRFYKPGTRQTQGIRLMYGDPRAPAETMKQEPYAVITRPGAKGNDEIHVPLKGNSHVDQEGGPGTYALGKAPPEEPAPARTPGEGPADPANPLPGEPAEPEPVEPVEPEPVEPVEPIEPIGPEDLIP